MRFYLSSFRVGDRASELISLASDRRIGFIPNALDHVEPEARHKSNQERLEEVRELGVDIELLDLADFFEVPDRIPDVMKDLGGVWVRGGNVFVLRQAMRLSAFDEFVTEAAPAEFLYAGYSAGVCVLAPRLEGLQHVDDPTLRPYPDSEVVWEGLGLLDYLVLPHYQSDHPESEAIDVEVEYCRREGIPFRTLRDGEILIIE